VVVTAAVALGLVALTAGCDLECPGGSCTLVDDFSEFPANWTDCTEDDAGYEAIVAVEGGVAVPDRDPGDPDPADAYGGIGCMYGDFHTEEGSFAVDFTGRPDGEGVEATPLLHVTPGTTEFGFGAWATELWTVEILLVGTIGSPPEAFEATHVAFLGQEWTPGELRLETNLVDEGLPTERSVVTAYFEDELQTFFTIADAGTQLNPLTELEVPEVLQGSTMHGFALDSHLAGDHLVPGISEFRAEFTPVE
jgi:hypothetical protein